MAKMLYDVFFFSRKEYYNFKKTRGKYFTVLNQNNLRPYCPQCCGSGVFIPDPGSEFFLPDPGSKRFRIRIHINEC
jgi:hypothetical protein